MKSNNIILSIFFLTLISFFVVLLLNILRNFKYENNFQVNSPSPTAVFNNPDILPSASVSSSSNISPKPSPTGAPKTPVPLTSPSSTNKPLQPEISWGNRNKRQVILTFDAGAGTQSIQPILSTLKKHNLKASFFITGKFAESNPEAVKAIAQGGHEVYNHTYNHPHLTQASDSTIIQELESANQLISGLTGKPTKPFFRPPFGERDQRVLQAAANAGYRSVYWTVDALDWEEDQGMTADKVKQRVYSNLAPGTIYLFHIGDNITGNILDDLIIYFENNNYSITSLSEGIK